MASAYGKGLYGRGLYSRTPPVELSGDLAPVIAFAAGELDIVGVVSLAGDLAPSIAFAGDLTGDFGFVGDFAPSVILAGDVTAGPLWGVKPPCGGQWSPQTLCDDPGWTSPDPDPVPWREDALCDG